MTAPQPAQSAENVRWLIDRADSYWRDSDVFAADGDSTMATAYRVISQELRRCATEVPVDPPPAPVVADPALMIEKVYGLPVTPKRRKRR